MMHRQYQRCRGVTARHQRLCGECDCRVVNSGESEIQRIIKFSFTDFIFNRYVDGWMDDNSLDLAVHIVAGIDYYPCSDNSVGYVRDCFNQLVRRIDSPFECSCPKHASAFQLKKDLHQKNRFYSCISPHLPEQRKSDVWYRIRCR